MSSKKLGSLSGLDFSHGRRRSCIIIFSSDSILLNFIKPIEENHFFTMSLLGNLIISFYTGYGITKKGNLLSPTFYGSIGLIYFTFSNTGQLTKLGSSFFGQGFGSNKHSCIVTIKK